MKRFISMIEGSNFKKGFLIQPYQYCLKNASCGRCAEFYRKLASAENGYYNCPYGMTSYVKSVDGHKFIFTCFKIKDISSKGVFRQKKENEIVYNPLLDKMTFENIVDIYVEVCQKEDEISKQDELNKDLLHEIRNLSTQLQSRAEEVNNNYSRRSENDLSFDLEHNMRLVKDIEAMAHMMTARFLAYDVSVNPMILQMGKTYKADIFNKFHKCRCIMNDYMNKHVTFEFIGDTHSTYEVYPTFDVLTFLLFENAVKYSPKNETVKVIFENTEEGVRVTISSMGPYCNEEEMRHLEQKGYRTESAKKETTRGSGLGLYLSRHLADIHNITMRISSRKTKRIRGIDYGPFEVELFFPTAWHYE